MDTIKKKAIELGKFIITSSLYSNEAVIIYSCVDSNISGRNTTLLDVENTKLFTIKAITFIPRRNDVDKEYTVRLTDKSKEVDIMGMPYRWSVEVGLHDSRKMAITLHVGADREITYLEIRMDATDLTIYTNHFGLLICALGCKNQSRFAYDICSMTIDKDHLHDMIAHLNEVEEMYMKRLYGNRLDAVIKEYTEFSGSPEIHRLNLLVDQDFDDTW